MVFDDNAFLHDLTPSETEALARYKRHGPYQGHEDFAKWLNAQLLHDRLDPQAEETIRSLDQATTRFRLPEPATLYRATFDFVMQSYDQPMFRYPAYMSVSRSDRTLSRHFTPDRPDCAGILLRIACPPGTPMALVEWTHPPDGADEKECLLPRDTTFAVREKRAGSGDELLRYAGPECADQLNGLEIWELTVVNPLER